MQLQERSAFLDWPSDWRLITSKLAPAFLGPPPLPVSRPPRGRPAAAGGPRRPRGGGERGRSGATEQGLRRGRWSGVGAGGVQPGGVQPVRRSGSSGGHDRNCWLGLVFKQGREG